MHQILCELSYSRSPVKILSRLSSNDIVPPIEITKEYPNHTNQCQMKPGKEETLMGVVMALILFATY